MAQYLLELPIKPYLKKYLLAITTGEEPVKAGRKDIVGLVLIGAIERGKSVSRKDLEAASSVKISFNDRLDMRGMDLRGKNTDPIIIPRHEALIIEKFFSLQFDQWLYLFIEANKIAKKEQKAAILHFLARYDITEEDINYETIKKRLYRTRERLKRLVPNS